MTREEWRSGADPGLGGSASEAAVSGQDGALVVPAQVALDRPDPLALLFTGQGVGATRAKELAALADSQLPLDRTCIHSTPPPAAGTGGGGKPHGRISEPVTPISIGGFEGALHVREGRYERQGNSAKSKTQGDFGPWSIGSGRAPGMNPASIMLFDAPFEDAGRVVPLESGFDA